MRMNKGADLPHSSYGVGSTRMHVVIVNYSKIILCLSVFVVKFSQKDPL
jgi:hypothetical protein